MFFSPMLRLSRAPMVFAAMTIASGCGASSSSTQTGASTASGGDNNTSAANAGIGKSPIPSLPSDGSTVQTWHLERDASAYFSNDQWTRVPGVRMTLAFDADGNAQMTNADGTHSAIDRITWNQPWLELRSHTASGYEWYRVSVVEGTLKGRWASSAAGEEPPLSSFLGPVTGWEEETFPLTSNALSWDLLRGADTHARVFIARRDASAPWHGTYKEYLGAINETFTEGLEHDLETASFDGTNLSFSWIDDTGVDNAVTATANGRLLTGTLAGASNPDAAAITGTRASVMSYGLDARTDRESWQSLTRARLQNMMMNGNPAPSSACTITEGSPLPPLDGTPLPDRDDAMASYPADYTRTEITFSCPLTNPFDGTPISTPRAIHGWYATPNAPPPPNGYPVVMALNGHDATANDVFTPSSAYYYGDAYARRGYFVLAIDIKHRLIDEVWDEDGYHPQIVGDAFTTSDFEEDGERTWDVARATDWLFARSDVNPEGALVTGLSMGGEVTTLVGGLDLRFSAIVPAGYSPNMNVMRTIHTHGCWEWQTADIAEYVDQSDLLALSAPRVLVVETGKQDDSYSVRVPPWSGDLQVVRRARYAWSEPGESLLAQHYLHYDEHAYHFGDLLPTGDPPLGLQATPHTRRATSVDWQVDGLTHSIAPTLFDYLMSKSQ